MGNLFGKVATQAAFENGAEWHRQLLDYININVDYVSHFFEENLPKVHVFRPEATYMIWLDFGSYGLSDDELKQKMIHEAGVGLNAGIDFGPGGESCMRMNVACPKSIVEEALAKIGNAFG